MHSQVVKVETASKNKESFFSSLSKASKFGLIIFLIAEAFLLVFFALATPLHYDEWYSYRHFTSQSLYTIISWYPAPNNHVFYNVITHYFVLPHINTAFAMRLPSIIAQLLSIWFLFKLCKLHMRDISAWVIVLVYSSSFNVLLYAGEARGYAFLNLFTVLVLVYALKFYANSSAKNLFIFSIVQALGVYTVPTFVYALFPVYLFLFLVFLIEKRYKRFLKLGAVGLLFFTLVIVLYLPILLGDSSAALLRKGNSEGKFSLHDQGVFESIIYFLNKMYYEVLGISHPGYLGGVIIGLLFLAHHAQLKGKLLFLFSFTMLASPFIILVVHHYFSYGRNWFFLCVPASILLGLVIELILNWSDKIANSLLKSLSATVILMITLAQAGYHSLQFLTKHRIEYALDYDIAEVMKIVPNVQSVARTEGEFEFYPAEVLQTAYEQTGQRKTVALSILAEQPNQELLIIARDKLAQQKINCNKYRFCYYTHNLFFFCKR